MKTIKIHRPKWKEYTLIKHEKNRIVSRQRVKIDEAKIFPPVGKSPRKEDYE